MVRKPQDECSFDAARLAWWRGNINGRDDAPATKAKIESPRGFCGVAPPLMAHQELNFFH
jgi:hypothetical protein